MILRVPPVTFPLAFATIAAGESGAATFALRHIAPQLAVFGPAPYYALTLVLCIVAMKPPSKATLKLLIVGLITFGYFLITATWSESSEYRSDKFIRTTFGPPIMLLSGYLIGRRWGVKWLVVASAIFALVVALTVFVAGEGGIRSLEVLLIHDESQSLNYQRFGILCGFAVACLVPALNRTDWLWFPLLVFLLICAVASGGRAGTLLVGVGLLARLSLMISPKVLIPVAVALSIAVYLMIDPLLTLALDVASSVGAPDTIKRALVAALEPPEITRVWNRPEFFRAAIEVWRESPFIGVGWGGYPRAVHLPDVAGFYPHNLFAELLAETGLVGLVLFSWFSTQTVLRLRCLPRSQFASVIWSILLCGVVISMVIGDLPMQWLLFVSFGLAAGSSDTVLLAASRSRSAAPFAALPARR